MGKILSIALCRGAYTTALPFTINEETGVILAGPLDNVHCSGVYKIIIRKTCGCDYLPVYLACRGPQLAPTNFDSNKRKVEEVCCKIPLS